MLTESSLHLPTSETPTGFSVAATVLGIGLIGMLTAAVLPYGGSVRDDELPPNAEVFAREVLKHEVEAQTQDNTLWSFCEVQQDDGKRKLLRVYQTRQGEIEREVSVNDQPLSAAQLRAEDRRIEKLISHPGEIRQHQKKQHEDGEQARNMLRMFPEAFRFQYDGTQGSLVRLRFSPNPMFHPPDHAAQVFHHMTGTMLVDPKQKRLAAINGTLTSEVKFFGGVFGHLDRGGTFAVEQQEVSPRVWEVTAMHVHMNGKALLFKTIAVQEDETYSEFHLVPTNTTLSQAAELLKREGPHPSQTQARN
jgi:hypothetical protein